MTSHDLNRRSALRVFGLATATLLTVGACSGASATPSESTGGRGGDFIYLDAEVTASMQVQVSFWQNSAVKDQMLDRLVYQDPKTFQFVPWIAESWTIDPTATVYTFVVRDGVSYSDGQPLDAASVARNLLWFAHGDADKGIPRNSIFPDVLSAVPDNDARTVTVTLQRPDAPFLATLSMNTSGLVADATIDATNEEQSVVTNLIGSGPFVAESEIPAKQIRLVKRRGYNWAPPTSEHQGEAYLDSLTIVPVREDSVRVGALLSRQAHALRYTQPPDEKLLQDNGFTVLGLRNPGLANVLDVRQTAEFVDDIRVRKALMYGIDRQEIIDTLYTDNWKVATNVTTEGVQGWTDRSDEVRFDPQESNRLLDDAGFTERNADGIRIRDGRPLDLSIYVDVYDHTSKPLYEFVQRQLRRNGISLTIKQTDFANYPKATTDPKLSLRRNGWPAPDPVRLSVNYDSERGDLFQLEGKDPILDELLREHITSIAPAERERILREAQDRIIDNAYTIPLLVDTQIFAVAPEVRGFRNAANSPPFFYDAWIEKE